MSRVEDETVPPQWRALIVGTWTPYGPRASTLGTVYAVIVGAEGDPHDRFIVRKLLEGADSSLLFSAIRRSAMSYRLLADVADRVGACGGDNVATIRERAFRHGDRDVREMAGAPFAR